MPGDPECLFCKLARGEIPAAIVDQDEHSVVFLDIAPANRGHLLVIPREHSADIHEIDAAGLARLHQTAQRMAARLVQRLGCDGVNILQSSGAAAWQSVFHFHIHVIPRYAGDPLVLPWQPHAADPAEIEAVARELG
ncbi:MAG TPA: HIT family protein [Baekduia sp.]|nr:HIT family protein [Baekduia sp.]